MGQAPMNVQCHQRQSMGIRAFTGRPTAGLLERFTDGVMVHHLFVVGLSADRSARPRSSVCEPRLMT